MDSPGSCNLELNGPVLLDRPVPSFTARSTHGQISLDDYKGQWLILFSHPADFTPVCTSEFIGLQRSIREFEQRRCALLGLSVDSIYSHLAWVRNIDEKFGVEISFPIIEDISMAISTAFGMLDQSSNNTSTVRSVFFIDPEGLLRAKILYPMQVGRSVAEIIRTLSALQSVNEHHMSAPEGWQPGSKMVPMAPTTVTEADLVLAKEDSTEWYYTDHTNLN
jgi:peroxiredoxin (alkyl hydroperoxide reductase subunit C)